MKVFILREEDIYSGCACTSVWTLRSAHSTKKKAEAEVERIKQAYRDAGITRVGNYDIEEMEVE